jgi:hypothetical protein
MDTTSEIQLTKTSPLLRYLYLSLGFVLVGLGVLGAFLVYCLKTVCCAQKYICSIKIRE